MYAAHRELYLQEVLAIIGPAAGISCLIMKIFFLSRMLSDYPVSLGQILRPVPPVLIRSPFKVKQTIN